MSAKEWVNLAHLEEHGLPGYPPPAAEPPAPRGDGSVLRQEKRARRLARDEAQRARRLANPLDLGIAVVFKGARV